MKEGDPSPSHQVGDYAADMTTSFGLIKDDREGIDYHVEQKRGERVTLADPT